jgi:endonuclease/exonuclease/phosphatase family metal-dependent hydrolase
MRLVTYNIHKGREATGATKDDIDRLCRALAAYEADVILCQEVFHDAQGRSSQSAALAHGLGMAAYYAPNAVRLRGHHGNATFTTWPVEHWENFDLSTNILERRGVLYVRAALSSNPLHLFNVHLGLNHRQRRSQLKRIQILIASLCPRDEALVLAGDFNDWHGRIDKVIVGDLGLKNALAHLPQPERRTWHARRPLLSLDRIYVRGLVVRRAERLVGEPWRRLSDHLPLGVDLQVGSDP